MPQLKIEVVFLYLVFVHYGDTAERIDFENLYTHLFLTDQTELLQNVRPSPYTEVTGSLSLLSISSLDEVSGTFSVMITLTLSWQDNRLVWNTTNFMDISNISVPVTKIWTPSVIMRNSAKRVRTLGLENNMVTILSSGKVILNIGDFLETSCSFDVKHFPFDRQNCEILFVPWLYPNSSVGFKQRVKTIDLKLFSENGMWKIIGSKASIQYIVLSSEYPGVVYAELKYSVEMERRSSYFVLTIFMPVIMLLLLNSAVFVLPIESGERVGYSITCLLALAVFLTLTSEVLPKTSDPLSVLSCFLMLLVMTSAMICTMTIITLWLHHKDEKSPMPMYLKKFTHVMSHVRRCRKPPTMNKTDASSEDSPTSKAGPKPKPFLVNDDEKDGSNRSNKLVIVKPAPVQMVSESELSERTDTEEPYSDITWKTFAELFNFLCLVLTLCLTGTFGSIYVLIAGGNL